MGAACTFSVFLVSSLVAGLYAVVIVLTRGKTYETWVNLRVLWCRLKVISQHLGVEDRLQTEGDSQQKKSNVIPFAVMIAIGFLGILVWQLLATPQNLRVLAQTMETFWQYWRGRMFATN